MSKNHQEFFLLLHEDKRNIYEQLAKNNYYFYQRTKGKKYSFITFISKNLELKITKEQQENINKRNQELKLVFIQQIAKDLKKGKCKEKELIIRVEQAKAKISQFNSNGNAEYLLNWVENLLITYWLKLKEQAPNQKNNLDKRMEKTISKLSAMFMSDYLYNENCSWVSKKEAFCPSCWKTQEDYLTGLVLDKKNIGKEKEGFREN